MTPETAREFAALEAQAQRIMGVFARAGYEAVAPAIIQPAGVFLDAVGEVLRARTYVFTDRDGAELCLRPDLTVPVCRLHLERAREPAAPARYCYNGAAFRYQPAGAGAAHPREFRQAGIESFGAPDPIAAEAETLDCIVAGIEATGIDRRALQMRFGDLALMRALLDALDMPAPWRTRLQARFGRPNAFKAALTAMTQGAARPAGRLPAALSEVLAGTGDGDVAARVVVHMEMSGVEAFGARGVAEVAAGIAAIVADGRAKPLSKATVDVIGAFIAIETPCRGAADVIHALARRERINLDRPLQTFNARLDRFAGHGLDLEASSFSGSFGRALGYYTGFVFEIGGPGLRENSPVAGGGRYDGLLRVTGSPVDIPAVGAAIHTERLLAAVRERAA